MDYLDKLIERRDAVLAHRDRVLEAVTRNGGKVTVQQLERAADCGRGLREVARVINLELSVAPRRFTTKEVIAARRHYDGLTPSDLMESYKYQCSKGGDFTRRGFFDWLVESAYESWYCQIHDC